MPHRVDSQGGGHLQFGGALQLRCRVLRVGQRIRPPDAADVVVRVGRTAASCVVATNPAVLAPLPHARRAASKSPRKMSTQLRCNRMRWMCSGFSISRQCRSALPETLVGVVELLDREGDQTEVQPAARHIVRPPALGDRRIGLVEPGSGPAPDRPPPTPPSHARIAFSPFPRSIHALRHGLQPVSATVRLRAAGPSRYRTCRTTWLRARAGSRRTRCRQREWSIVSITFSQKGTDCTCRSSSHSALAHRIRAKVTR